jgi:hypothetical protein
MALRGDDAVPREEVYATSIVKLDYVDPTKKEHPPEGGAPAFNAGS